MQNDVLLIQNHSSDSHHLIENSPQQNYPYPIMLFGKPCLIVRQKKHLDLQTNSPLMAMGKLSQIHATFYLMIHSNNFFEILVNYVAQ